MVKAELRIISTGHMVGFFKSSGPEGHDEIHLTHSGAPYIYLQKGKDVIGIQIKDVEKFASLLNRYVKKVKEELE